jgi:3-deoxy-D-arabino-heptulosonate 7-phosphate (DAHP) synthase class II
MVLYQGEETTAAGVSIRVRGAYDAVARFTHPMTRMLLAGDGLTTPALEALVGSALQVRVLRQDVVCADAVTGVVGAALAPDEGAEVVVRRSCLVDAESVPASLNYVVAVRHRAAEWGIQSSVDPIGPRLVARGAAQQRQLLWAGTARWLDGRACAAKAYVIRVHTEPLCYIRECFNPDLIAADTATRGMDIDRWNDEVRTDAQATVEAAATTLRPDGRPAAHQPAWPDPDAARRGVDRLASLPPLVSSAECDELTADLAAAVEGRAFVLHLGDCAETFQYCDTEALTDRQALAAAASALVGFGSGLRPVVIGRIAGEYAKPRSRPVEADSGLVSYFGDMVNSHEPNSVARIPDPERMVSAYFHAAATVNHLRTHPAPPGATVAELVERAAAACAGQPQARLLRDMAGVLSVATAQPRGARRLDGLLPALRVSHEALVLAYEHALTRRTPDDRWWNSSAHLVWIGERTRGLDEAHIRFVEQISNPVGVKLGPTTTAADVEQLCRRLNPHRIPGRLTLIPRLGADRAGALLPPLLAAAEDTPVCWISDPMHANTFVTDHGHKTRRLDDIAAEIGAFFQACRDAGVTPAGLHLETAPEQITECVGGWQDIGAGDLAGNYLTRCDPRLNPVQTLQVASVLLDELTRVYPDLELSNPLSHR